MSESSPRRDSFAWLRRRFSYDPAAAEQYAMQLAKLAPGHMPHSDPSNLDVVVNPPHDLAGRPEDWRTNPLNP